MWKVKCVGGKEFEPANLRCRLRLLYQRILTYFVRGSIIVQLTFCFISLDSATLFMLNKQHIHLFSQIQSSRNAGSDTSPFKVIEHSLALLTNVTFISPNVSCRKLFNFDGQQDRGLGLGPGIRLPRFKNNWFRHFPMFRLPIEKDDVSVTRLGFLKRLCNKLY